MATISSLAGKPAPPSVFATSGHRDSSLDAAFTGDHILAITQAISRWRTDGAAMVGSEAERIEKLPRPIVRHPQTFPDVVGIESDRLGMSVKRRLPPAVDTAV